MCDAIDNYNCDYYRNKWWPEPYINSSRTAVRARFKVMACKGWEEQNLIGPHLFKPESGELTDQGLAKIRWIATQAPENFRIVYVERTEQSDIMAERIEAARAAAQRFALPGEVVQVAPSNLQSHGWPAEYVVTISDKFQATIPDPRLPKDNGGVLGSGGGGSQ